MTTTIPPSTDAADWRSHLIEDDAGIERLLGSTRRIAVLGIKTAESGQPAYYVAEYAKRAGYEVIPVPVYYPDVTEILDSHVYRTVNGVPGPVDMVNVFRRPSDIDARTSTTSSRSGRRQSGSSWASATIKRRSAWLARGLTWCRIAACWWS